MSAPPPPVTPVTFSRGTWIALVAFALVMFAGIGLQLSLIEDQRSTTDDQLRTAVRQANRAIPLMERTRPLVDQTTAALPAVRRLGRDTTAFLDAATPLARALNDARADEQLQAAGALARALLAAGAPRAVQVVAEELPRAADAATRIADELLTQQRLRRLLVRTTSVLGEVQARNLVAKSSRAAEVVPELETILRQSLDIQRETLAATREAVAIGRATRDIAAETRQHARDAAEAAKSLDRKTGPSLTPASGG